jgi:hypothetical protein
LGENNIIVQKLAHYEMYNKKVKNYWSTFLPKNNFENGFSLKENFCLTGIIL